MEARIDGNWPLKDQENSIGAMENAQNMKLVSFQKSNKMDKKINDALFVGVELGEDIPDIVLIDVQPEHLAEVDAEQKEEGRNMIFYSPAYVSGTERKVAGFR